MTARTLRAFLFLLSEEYPNTCPPRNRTDGKNFTSSTMTPHNLFELLMLVENIVLQIYTASASDPMSLKDPIFFVSVRGSG